jgi:hypothetical protein
MRQDFAGYLPFHHLAHLAVCCLIDRIASILTNPADPACAELNARRQRNLLV